jgi:predicted nuclease of predicted toxin-antitoxin system
MADAMHLACARQEKAILITQDHDFSGLSDIIIL